MYEILSPEASNATLLKENPNPVLTVSIGVNPRSNLINPEKKSTSYLAASYVMKLVPSGLYIRSLYPFEGYPLALVTSDGFMSDLAHCAEGTNPPGWYVGVPKSMNQVW